MRPRTTDGVFVLSPVSLWVEHAQAMFPTGAGTGVPLTLRLEQRSQVSERQMQTITRVGKTAELPGPCSE